NGLFSLDPLNLIFPGDALHIASPLLFVNEIIVLLKVVWLCVSRTALTFTFLFLSTVVCLALMFPYYLLAFFLLATVFLFPFRVLELFFVLWPLKGNPSL